MPFKWISILLLAVLGLAGCQSSAVQNGGRQTGGNPAEPKNAARSAVEPEKTVERNEDKGSKALTDQPRTVRDFFNLLPEKYFLLEGCEPAEDRNCERARAEYVKNYLEIEDAANGYWKSGCDGAQSCLQMALFKRPDAGYVVGVHTLHEANEINHFLEYRNGNWIDVSAQVVPEFSDRNIYELPRYGTTVAVYKKVFPEPEFSERGAKIYELEWKNGKFTKK
ncbi:MAG TPA: hypothetical protein VIL74_21795 [Pyrinomonadaceae bacterium]